MSVLLLALGAATGTAVRLLAGARVGGRRATLAVNVVGCLLLGLLLDVPPPWTGLVMGFAGGLTTFSTWAVETVEGGGWRYAAVTTVLCLTAAATGLGLATVVTG